MFICNFIAANTYINKNQINNSSLEETRKEQNKQKYRKTEIMWIRGKYVIEKRKTTEKYN